ncbi:class I SAM-dependent methyltransferase [Roseicella aerolata]|uniref:Methyltransferase domain-containing protein n=1 Tax=Roseicella aerolata TaxID=2883479 RepID=A0A9X1IDA3_9PROT|nr:class I SAM-dependent methyltransferase [Roseicella aerolata]MCB4822604.1 methyltransferase domain-containing protein [Roseicella aerolata]
MAIQPHNEKAAATWGSGGADYDRISESIADSIEHLLNRLDIRPGERALDLATGTGWTARRLAQKGAKVTGLDIGAGVIEAARRLAEQANLRIDFRVGDAEAMELPDAGFDVITSTCGVMFASRPEAVASELARLCRPGGRIGLTTWPPDGAIAGVFQVMRPYMPPPPGPPPPSPFEWGREARLRELLGDAFELQIETGTTVLRMPDAEAVWQLFSTGYGPTRMLLQNTDRKEALKRDFLAFHEAHRTPMGITMPRDYLVVVGRRR